MGSVFTQPSFNKSMLDITRWVYGLIVLYAVVEDSFDVYMCFKFLHICVYS